MRLTAAFSSVSVCLVKTEKRTFFFCESVSIQRFNCVILHDSFADDYPHVVTPSFLFQLLFLTLGIYNTEGAKINK